MQTPVYMGYRSEDYVYPYSKYYSENIAPLSGPVREALQHAPLPAGQLPPFENAALLTTAGYGAAETGYTLESDGSLRVAVLTRMPGVTPRMWDWWFGWHGSRADRYKLWHPKAHRSARWKDGRDDLEEYIGRSSLIEEYIGTSMEKATIRFIDPAELGIPPCDPEQAVFICARIGYSRYPLDFGWLVHQVRVVEGGAEMRSRFWMGGPHIRLRFSGALPGLVSRILQKTVRLPEKQAIDLLSHCSEEMNHLAAFLPALYTEQQTSATL